MGDETEGEAPPAEGEGGDVPAVEEAASEEAPAEEAAGEAPAEGGEGDAPPAEDGGAAAEEGREQTAAAAEGDDAGGEAGGGDEPAADGDAPAEEGVADETQGEVDESAAAADSTGKEGGGEESTLVEGESTLEGGEGETTMEEGESALLQEGETTMEEGESALDKTGDVAGESRITEGEEGAGEQSVDESAAVDDSAMLDESQMEGTEAEAEAAVMIQSLARGKAAQRRVQRIKAGEEDPFEMTPDVGGAGRGGEEHGGGEQGGEERELGGELGGGDGEGGGAGEGDVSQETAEEDEEKRLRDERRRAEQEARQAKVQEKIEITRKYSEALANREKLASQNADLQKRLAAHYASKKQEEGGGQMDEQDQVSADLEQRYFQSLRQVADSRSELEKVQINYDHIVLDMKTRLEQKQEKVRELREQFTALKSDIAGGGSSGGRAIPPKLLRQFEDQEKKKEEELERVRLKNIHLRNQLRKLEGHLRRKEELSNELHLIDFEQLKIENQTLNEKIEERNEELLKLRKKTTTTVQVLTHLKEKLQFVQAENQLLKVELAELEAELSTHRDALTKAKHDRDSLRSENLRLRGEAGLIGNNDLLRDFDRRKKDIAAMQVTLEGLKMRHRALKEHIAELGTADDF